MPLRSQAFAWMLAMGLWPLPSAAQDRTERELVDVIVRDGPQARAIRADVEVVRREQRARLAYPNPRVAYSREGAGFTEFLQVEQPLPLFGVRAALSRAGVAAGNAAEAERDLRLARLRADARTAIARLVSWQARLDARSRHIEELARLIELLQTREREGEGSRFDRLRAEEDLRDARQQLTAALVGVEEARASVLAMLPDGATLERVSEVDDDGGTVVTTVGDLQERASTGHAELRVLRGRIAQVQAEGDVALRGRLPSPIVSGGLKRSDNDSLRETGGVVGVGVMIPLFDRGGRDAARWEAERLSTEAERVAIERRVRADILASHQTLEARRAAADQDRASNPEELMQIAEVAYREGEIGILELLDAVRTVVRARVRSLEITLDVRLAAIELERAMGGAQWP